MGTQQLTEYSINRPWVRRLVWPVLILAVALLSSCGEAVFDSNAAADLLNEQRVELRGEQVALDPTQFECGEKEGLWVVSSLGGGRQIARLNDSARNLGFSNDILRERSGLPHAQVNGSFILRAKRASSLDDVNAKTKRLKAAVGIQLDHRCFGEPLAILGVRNGEFREDEDPAFVFQLVSENQWAFDRLIH